MAGKTKEMSLIKQVIQLKMLGRSNRGIARELREAGEVIDKGTVNGYMKTVERNGWELGWLLTKEDPDLERMFHAGSPAYTDRRMEEFLGLLPYFREQLSDRRLHVTGQLLWEENRVKHPEVYGKSQFYEHLRQNLVAQKDIVTVLVLPCDPASPTQKALVEDAVRITYNRIAAKLRKREFHSLRELNEAVQELCTNLNQTRMQKLPYTREERFHAMEKPLLAPLPETVHEMRYHADLKLQNNCFVELRHDKVTHHYSVPHAHVGRKARVVFTRSWVKIYIDGKPVATHQRKHAPGYTYQEDHLASKSTAVINRSSAYYTAQAGSRSEECRAYVERVFSPERTNQPEEVYYRLYSAVLSSYRSHDAAIVDLTCRQCLENNVFSYRSFEAILKHNSLTQASDETCQPVPAPTGHANMRGNGYFE